MCASPNSCDLQPWLLFDGPSASLDFGDGCPGEVSAWRQSEEVAWSEEMAAAGLSMTVTHSNEKHSLQVTPQEGNSEPVVQDLAQVVEEATGVPLPFQKLIFKGKPFSSSSEPI